MTRKESEKEAERPHYYSQFWLDVAAGRRIIGTPKTNEEGDLEESEAPILSRPVRHSSSTDGYHETIAHPEVEPDFETDDDTYAEPELEETEPIVDEEEEAEEIEVPPIVVEEEEIPDVDFAPVDAEEEVEEEEEKEDDFFDEEEEDEEEDEDIGWGGARGRKKPKPGRQAKLPPKPPVKKPTKRPRSF